MGASHLSNMQQKLGFGYDPFFSSVDISLTTQKYSPGLTWMCQKRAFSLQRKAQGHWIQKKKTFAGGTTQKRLTQRLPVSFAMPKEGYSYNVEEESTIHNLLI
jgi:hypothetical protein